MPTASSSSTGYADSDDLRDRYDVRVLCELVSDDKNPVAVGDLSVNGRIVASLLGASGELEAALSVGKRYTPADLAALTGSSLAFLKDTVCALALHRIYRARPDMATPAMPAYQEAQGVLDRLRSGKWCFGLEEQQQAGNLDLVAGSVTDSRVVNGVVMRASRYFGARMNSNPPLP